MRMHPAVFLDLDKTILQDTGGPADPNNVALIQGAAPAIASLRGLGYKIVVAANHEGIARGQVSEDDVHTLHTRVAELVKATANGAVIDAFYYCPYHPQGTLKQFKKDHPTRKPRPGMLTQAAEEMSLDLSASWMIGDELADVQAGHAAGTRTVLLRPDAEQLKPMDPEALEGVTSETPDRDRPTGPDFFAVSLVDAARLIAQQPRETQEPETQKPGRRWDAAKIAKIQVPRPESKASQEVSETAAPARAFRPWGAPVKEDDEKPIVAKPYRKRQGVEQLQSNGAGESTTAPSTDQQAAAKQQPPPQDIPAPIRQAIKKKRARPHDDERETDKTLRLILHELRAQRGASQEFSFLTIIAVAMQLIAVVCLLGGLFMGSGDDGLFLRWLGAGLMAQLLAISTMLYGR